MKTTLTKSLLAAAVVAMTVGASAAHAEREGGYVSASIGSTLYDRNDTLEGTGLDIDDSISFDVTLGGRAGYLGVEASYIEFGEADIDMEDSFGSAEADTSGINLALVGFVPVVDGVELYGKVGALLWDTDISGGGMSESTDGRDISFGLGAAIYATDNVSVVTEYNMYQLEDMDVDNLSLGLQLNF